MTETSPALPSYRLDDGVAIVEYDDGKANVLSSAVLAELDGHLDRALDDGARAFVLAGRPGMFSGGFDLREMTASVESMRSLVATGARFLLRTFGFGLPTVAACTGHALAGGALTLMSCDVRVGADVPSKIGLNEVAIGMALPKFAVELARVRLAPALLAASTMEARIYDPAGAVEVGYLDQVVPADQVLDAAIAEARRLAELRTGAYALTKTQLRGDMIAAQLAVLEADLVSLTATV